MKTTIGRRGFLGSLLGLLAAPVLARLPSAPAARQVVYANRTMRLVTDVQALGLSAHDAFLEGMSQRITKTMIYGDPEAGPTLYKGLAILTPDEVLPIPSESSR